MSFACSSTFINSLASGNLVTDKEHKNRLHNESDDSGDELEKVLHYIGDLGKYQIILFITVFPAGFLYAYTCFGQMFITATPQNHWCRVPELSHLNLELSRNLSIPSTLEGKFDRCQMYAANWSQVLQTMQPPPSDTPTVPCQHGWEYNLTDIPYHTVVSERGWVCEYSSYGPTSQSVFFVGSFFGGLLMGWISDRFGRIPSYVVSNLLAAIGGVATFFTTGFWDFALARFIVGMAIDSSWLMIYIIVFEYIGPKYRTAVSNLFLGIFYGLGCLLLPWTALWIGDWRNFVLWSSLPLLSVLAVPFLVPESARWLLSKGKVNRAVKVLRKLEKINGAEVPQEAMDDLIVAASQTHNKHESLLVLFKNGTLCTMMIFLILIYMFISIIFDCIVRMSEGLGVDFFMAFSLSAATEFPAIILMVLFLEKWGRRFVTLASTGITTAVTLIAVFLPSGVPQVTMATISRFCMNIAMGAITQWSSELLPTVVRGSGSSLLHISAFVAVVVSPFIVYSKNLWSPLPMLILAIISLTVSILEIFLPETKGTLMPQTIADGENIVLERSILLRNTRKMNMEVNREKSAEEKESLR